MDDDLKALCKRLEAVRYQREDWHEPYGAIDLPCDADDDGAVAVPRNPDGPEAAKAIRTLLSALRQRDEALEPFAKIGGQMMRTPDQRPLTLHGNAVEPDGIPSKGTWTGLTAGHFRKARAILTGSETATVPAEPRNPPRPSRDLDYA